MLRTGTLAKFLDRLLIASWAGTFAVAGLWAQVSSEPFPFAGLRSLVQAGGWNLALQVAGVLVGAACLALPAWQTKRRLHIFSGLCFMLFLVGCLFIGVPFGLAFVCFAGMARSRAAGQPTVTESAR